ncbi:UNVERIFIED_CONTAM: hypothetical protein PYX00_000594 [Menopon gallinae]|uniref:Uncharacterized protein n=1 Tax=Menopon gallinae TaxID=328185 RepID=A0AAW2IAY8_9NEOP
MSDLENEPAYKFFIEDLRSFQGSRDEWFFQFGEGVERTKINKFQIQAKICQVNGLDNEILLIYDDTGKAKATRSSKVPGDFSWVKPDTYCSLVGSLLDNGKLPHINIIKLAKVDNMLLQQMWPEEVKEIKDFLGKKIVPDITT